MSDQFLPTVEKRICLSVPMRRISQEKVHSIYPVLFAARSMLNGVTLWVLVLLFGLGIIAPLATMDNFVVNAAMAVVLAALLLIGTIAPIYLRTTKLRITNDGLHFPICMASVLNNRMFRPWHDLEFADVHHQKSAENQIPGQILSLTFKSGGQVDLHLARIGAEDLLQLQKELRTGLEAGLSGSNPSGVAMADSSVHPLPVICELLPRACLENLHSKDFIAATGHRRILSSNFGLGQTELVPVGDCIYGGEYTVQKVLAANDARAAYLVADSSGQQLHAHQQDLSFLGPEERSSCLLQMEAMAAKFARLEIEGLTRVVAARADGDKFFLITDFAQGVSLRDTICETKTLKEEQALNMVRQLAQILHRLYCADPLLYVGSIRPDCVIQQADGRFFIAELGLVNCILSHHCHVLLHDSAYADLQQLRGSAAQASDLYALGAVLYFVLTGHDPQPLAINHVRSIRYTLSRSIDDLTARLMAPHPLDCSALLYELGVVASENLIQPSAASNDKAGEV